MNLKLFSVLVVSLFLVGCGEYKQKHVLHAWQIEEITKRCELFKQAIAFKVEPDVGGVTAVWCEPMNPRATYTF